MPLFAWLTLATVSLSLLGFFAYRHYTASPPTPPSSPAVAATASFDYPQLPNHKKYEIAPKLFQNIYQYFQSASAPQRAAFVHNSSGLVIAMNRYYEDTPLEPPPPASILTNAFQGKNPFTLSVSNISQSPLLILQIPNRKSASSDQDGGFEFIFHFSADGWKLDWPHAVRYSTANWKSFLLSQTPASATFRLYAEDNSLNTPSEDKLSLRLTLPVHSRITGRWSCSDYSPPISIPKDSDLARKLTQAWQRQKDRFPGAPGFFDPPNTCRVTCRLSITPQLKSSPIIAIDEITSTDWFVADEPTPSSQPPH